MGTVCAKPCRNLKNYTKSCKAEMANPFEVFYFPHAYFKQNIYISFFLTF